MASGQQTFSFRAHRVNILYFEGHIVSVETAQLSHSHIKMVIEYSSMNWQLSSNKILIIRLTTDLGAINPQQILAKLTQQAPQMLIYTDQILFITGMPNFLN